MDVLPERRDRRSAALPARTVNWEHDGAVRRVVASAQTLHEVRDRMGRYKPPTPNAHGFERPPRDEFVDFGAADRESARRVGNAVERLTAKPDGRRRTVDFCSNHFLLSPFCARARDANVIAGKREATARAGVSQENEKAAVVAAHSPKGRKHPLLIRCHPKKGV